MRVSQDQLIFIVVQTVAELSAEAHPNTPSVRQTLGHVFDSAF